MEDNDSREVEIFRKQVNNTLLILNVKILSNGDLSMEGHDIGDAPRQAWGHDDYEYAVSVGAEHKDRVLLLLIKERFDTRTPSSDFMEWLKANNIPNEFSSWP